MKTREDETERKGWGSGMNQSGKYFIDSYHFTSEAGTALDSGHCGTCTCGQPARSE